MNEAYGNEITIGNIENLHNNYVAKMKQNEKNVVSLDDRPVIGKKGEKKKGGCC